MSILKIKSTTNYKNQSIELREWTTCTDQPASAWTWQPAWELRKEMPWLPVSMGRKTLGEMQMVVDWYLDNVDTRQAEHKLTINKEISWN